ncbi:hypothetical protein F5Y16DRAFT_215593 [Xylariaceae sp. FL0255]|nr:hypothetical protein F5Y16DRAFT_215593 [Xylariaceae sp. FL0255]
MPRITKFNSQPLVHQLSLPYLLIPPVLFTIAAGVILATHGDLNTPQLYSQCHARARLPALSHIPLIGAPFCFIVSFFMFAVGSMRSVAILAPILSFVAALLTASRVEAARVCNQRSWNIRHPTLSWLVFNLVGGTVVWDLWIVPIFLARAKAVRIETAKSDALLGGAATSDVYEDERRIMRARSLDTRAEVFAIPAAVALGFVVPSVLMLVLKDTMSVIIWLFFPLWVAAIHWIIKLEATNLLKEKVPIYLESYPSHVTAIYIVPFVASVLTHAFFIWKMFCGDDSREMTRTAIKFIGIDFAFIAATVLYWILVEAGPLPAALLVILSAFIGPGGALCVVWPFREKTICAFAIEDEESEGESSHETNVDETRDSVQEDTPLIR